MILKLHATPQEVMRGVETLETFAREQGVPEKAIFGLTLALEECGANIVTHGLQQDASRTFEVALRNEENCIVVELHDDGPAFDPTAAPERSLVADDDEPPGGWGVQLVRRYIDEILYSRAPGENILILKKRFTPESGSGNVQ